LRFLSEGDPKIAKIRQQLGEVKDVMLENIDRVLLRGEKIELLVDKTSVQLDCQQRSAGPSDWRCPTSDRARVGTSAPLLPVLR
jgi:hypothetical protein